MLYIAIPNAMCIRSVVKSIRTFGVYKKLRVIYCKCVYGSVTRDVMGFGVLLESIVCLCTDENR